MSSQTINIAGLKPVEDPSYRYKMPKLEYNWVGKGGGKKTVLINCAKVAKALYRNPEELCKWFGIDLGVPASTNNILYIKGHHTYPILYQSLCMYIEIFVLCPICRQPEVPCYKVKKGEIKMRCNGCGHRYVIDSDNKLCTFILKNESQKKKKSEKDNKKKDKKSKKLEKKQKKKEVVEESDESEESEEEHIFEFDESIIQKYNANAIIENIMKDFEILPMKDFFVKLKIQDLASDLSRIEPNDILKALEDFCLKSEIKEKAVPIFAYILQVFYEKDVLSDENILTWSFLKEDLPKDSAGRLVYNEETIKFIEWLSSEDSSDEE